MKFRYDIVGTGWAECTLEYGGQEATLSASYLSDALDDLFAAVVSVLRGESTAEASFVEEPGEFRWQFERRGATDLRILITEYAEMPSNNRRAPIAVVLVAEDRLRTFGGAVLSELQRLDRELGEIGYAEKWHMHRFPAKRITQLQSLLA